jgi:hypothetical protein
MSEEKAITLHLAEWQKRMVMDHVKGVAQNFSKIQVSNILHKEHHLLYMPPTPENASKGAWGLYLTDEQINHVTDAMGIKTKISALNITPGMLESKAVVFK